MAFQISGLGWQVLPAMAINSVPYANYANLASRSVSATYAKLAALATSAENLNGYDETDFATSTGLGVCAGGEVLTYTAVGFDCVAQTGSGSSNTIISLGFTAPISNTGTASSPIISIAQASSSVNGYLSSADFISFSQKLNATSSSIATALGAQALTVSSTITLSGDVTGNKNSNVVSFVNGKTASQVSTSVDDTIAATSVATASTIAKRDLSGNIQFNNVGSNITSVNQLRLYNGVNAISFLSPVLASSYTLTFPASGGATGQVLTTDGSGILSWSSPSAGSVIAVSGTANQILGMNSSASALEYKSVSAGANISIANNAGELVISSSNGGGTVTNVSATAPLASTGGSTPTLSITQATSATNGFLSSTDWNIFNNKLSVSLTAVTSNQVIQYNGSQFVNKQIPTCTGTQYLTYNGSNYSCVTDSGSAGTVASVSGTANEITVTGTTNAIVSLANNGVVSGTYTKVIVDSKGRVSSGTQLTATDIISALTYTPLNPANSGMLSTTGDVTGTLSATVVTQVGGQTSAAVALATTTVNVATSLNVSNTIVRRDGSGNFVASRATFENSVQIKDGSVGGVIGLFAPVGFTSYNLTLPTTSGTANQVLTTNGVGVLSWTTPAAAASASQWTTSGTSIFYSTGNVGIGTSNPLFKLSISGTSINEKTIAINDTPVIFLPDQTNYMGSIAIGDGLRLGNHASGADGHGNTSVGFGALRSNTTGQNNTANGYNSLYTNTTGNYNIANGVNALFSNTTGGFNTAIGVEALNANTTGSGNIAIGSLALYLNTTGTNNIANGSYALVLNTTGSYNIATGDNALRSNTTGIYSIAYGAEALYSSTTGNYNIASGRRALYSNTTGINNIATGYEALRSNITGSSNVAYGPGSLYFTTGSNNTAIGLNSGGLITTGNNNVVLGSNDGSIVNGTSNNIIISDGSGNIRLRVTSSGELGIGTVSPSATLDVSGTLKFAGSTTPVSGGVLTSDAAGIATWRMPATGTVTNVSATTPLASTGGSTPTLSITQATSSTNGYLLAADWLTFNNKVTVVSGTASDITVTGTTSSPVLTLASTAVSAGTYGSASSVGLFVVDAKGRITSATTAAINNLNTSVLTTGTLAVNRGGTGLNTLTVSGVLIGNGTSAVNTVTPGSSGTVLTINSTGTPVWLSPSATTSIALSSLTSATATNTIDNTDFAQTWGWSTLSTQNALTISASALTTGSLLNLTTPNAAVSSTNGLLYVANTSAGTSGTIARFQSNSTAGSGLTVLANGNVGIGISAPRTALDILGQSITVRGTGTTAGEIRFAPGPTTGTNYVGFKAPLTNPASSTVWRLPAADGSVNQVLSTDGAGTLSWATAGAGSTGQMYGQLFTANGTFTTPAGTSTSTRYKITVVGGGGGGASACSYIFNSGCSSVAGYYNGADGGNGAGAIYYGTGYAVGVSMTITVGAGGAEDGSGTLSRVVVSGVTITANPGTGGSCITNGTNGIATNGTYNVTGGALLGGSFGVAGKSQIDGAEEWGSSINNGLGGTAGGPGAVLVEWIQ